MSQDYRKAFLVCPFQKKHAKAENEIQKMWYIVMPSVPHTYRQPAASTCCSFPRSCSPLQHCRTMMGIYWWAQTFARDPQAWAHSWLVTSLQLRQEHCSPHPVHAKALQVSLQLLLNLSFLLLHLSSKLLVRALRTNKQTNKQKTRQNKKRKDNKNKCPETIMPCRTWSLLASAILRSISCSKSLLRCLSSWPQVRKFGLTRSRSHLDPEASNDGIESKSSRAEGAEALNCDYPWTLALARRVHVRSGTKMHILYHKMCLGEEW